MSEEEYLIGKREGELVRDLQARAERAEAALENEARLRIKDCEDRNAYKRRANIAEARVARLETLLEAVKWALHTDVWIDDNPFHGPMLTPNGTTKTEVWDNLRDAYDAALSEEAK